MNSEPSTTSYFCVTPIGRLALTVKSDGIVKVRFTSKQHNQELNHALKKMSTHDARRIIEFLFSSVRFGTTLPDILFEWKRVTAHWMKATINCEKELSELLFIIKGRYMEFVASMIDAYTVHDRYLFCALIEQAIFTMTSEDTH